MYRFDADLSRICRRFAVQLVVRQTATHLQQIETVEFGLNSLTDDIRCSIVYVNRVDRFAVG